MGRATLEVADVIRAAADTFFNAGHKWITWMHVKVIRAILACRTPALGAHVDRCSQCEHQVISFNSCLMGSISFWGVRPRNQRCSRFEWTLRLPITNRALLLRWCVPPPF